MSDGLIQALELKAFGDDYRGIRRGEKIDGILFWPSMYALGWAATASPALAFGSILLTFLAWPQYGYLRLMPSLWPLAMAIYASRTDRRWAWRACGSLLPVAFCVGVEFAVYAGGAVLVALRAARGPRARHLQDLLVGVLASASFIALVLAGVGVAGAFARATFLDLRALLPAYAIPLARPVFPWSPGGSLADRTTFLYAFLAFAALLLGALLPRAPAVGMRGRPLVPVLAWILLATVSVVERRHIGYPFFLIPLGLVLAARWFRGNRPQLSARGLAASTSLILVIALWQPWPLARGLAFGIANRGTPPGFTVIEQPLRASGALFRPSDAALVLATDELLRDTVLSRDDTWLDFANAPGLYYLFDRDCPIRYYEVPYYESEAAQAEVIAAVARNPRVRAVLVASGLPSESIDGIPNAVRAPLVAKFIEENFRPYLRRGGVEFWLRRDPGGASPAPTER